MMVMALLAIGTAWGVISWVTSLSLSLMIILAQVISVGQVFCMFSMAKTFKAERVEEFSKWLNLYALGEAVLILLLVIRLFGVDFDFFGYIYHIIAVVNTFWLFAAKKSMKANGGKNEYDSMETVV